MLSDTQFAVVDVETTGIFSKGTDRIIEIAVLRVDLEGNTLDEYCTLVNPQRDLGPSSIHGITARQVRHAPSFREIAGDILTRLAGAVFVAHNAQFDKGFVRSEMDRLNCTLPDFPHLCTMRLARRAVPGIVGRRLGEICRHFGITIGRAHSAYADARAASGLFKSCVARLGDPARLSLVDLGVVGKWGSSTPWPALSPRGKAYRREDANCEIRSEPCYVAQLVARLPAADDVTEEVQDYLALLDMALEDRRISVEEADALLSLATESGMGREQAVSAHHRYMRDLICVALDDGFLSEAEMRDLDEVRALLGISEVDYVMLFDEADAQIDAAKKSPAPSAPKRLNLTGKTICFTGELAAQIDGRPATREDAVRAAEVKGMVVKTSVTRALDYLVAADPDTMSGKANKAREYGVRIIAEPVFWNMVDSAADSACQLPLARVLASLQIGFVGPAMAHKLASAFDSLDRLAEATEAELMTIAGVGPQVAHSIREWSERKESQNVLTRKRSSGVNMLRPRARAAEAGPLAGKTVVVTGTLEGFSRKEAEDLVKQLGGTPTASVSKKTDLVVYGASPGSKLNKARELGVETIDEGEFLKRIGRG